MNESVLRNYFNELYNAFHMDENEDSFFTSAELIFSALWVEGFYDGNDRHAIGPKDPQWNVDTDVIEKAIKYINNNSREPLIRLIKKVYKDGFLEGTNELYLRRFK
ncbi:MAG: hypothetical protein WC783_02655 [Candidatus Paceibacterota bacterium]|jgi:hypothetical protein